MILQNPVSCYPELWVRAPNCACGPPRFIAAIFSGQVNVTDHRMSFILLYLTDTCISTIIYSIYSVTNVNNTHYIYIRLDIRKHFFSARVVLQWHNKEVAGSPRPLRCSRNMWMRH